MSIPRAMGELVYVDTEQMIEVDRAMVEDFHIDLIQMMENAGRNLAALGREGIDKLTCRRGLALWDRVHNALYVDASPHSERILRSKDA